RPTYSPRIASGRRWDSQPTTPRVFRPFTSPAGAGYRERVPPRPRRSEMVADATLVSLAAVRQAVKNVMLVRALRDDVDFDEEWYADAARRELEELAGEAAAEAARLREVREATRRRRGVARAADDYRAADSRHLKRRARVLEELVEELGRLTQDDTTVSTLIAEARLRALDEITATTASVPGLGRERAATGIARSRALQSLREELSDYAD